MAGAIAIITSLCGFRKKLSPKSSPIIKVDRKSSELTKEKAVVNDEDMKELSVPPSMTQQARLSLSSSKPNIKKSASEKKLLSTLSMKAQRSLSMVKNNINQKDEQKNKGKLKHEDSIWMKTIILGEKCKVAHEENGAIIYEANGKRISAYHPRTISSLSVSRQCSSIEQDSIPIQKGKLEDDDDKQHQQNYDHYQVVNMSSNL